MFNKGKDRRKTHHFDSKQKDKGIKTKLPPKNYLHMNDNKEIQVPNLVNIYRHEYKSKHFQFGTSLPTETYKEELEQVAKQCSTTIREINLTEKDMSWIGDEMEYQDEWPIQKETFRIAQLNVNGFSFTKDNFKIDMFLQSIMAMQVDVATIQEINLNLNNNKIQEELKKAMKRFDQRAVLQIATVKHNESKDTYLPGGNAVWSSGMHTGRIQRKGQEKYGRWAYTVMLGQKNQEIMIISAYNTCKNTAEDGRTIAGQLVRAMHKEGSKRKYNLRRAFFQDIQEFILKERQDGTEIILSMDANTKASAEELKTLKLSTNLVDIFAIKHPTTQHPKTYYRGKDCLDYIYATPYIAQGIKKVGYAPFYEMGKYDHRVLYVDLDWKYIFKHKMDVTQARGRQLSIKNRRMTKLYLRTLNKLEEKAGIYKGIEKIRKKMKKKGLKDDEKEYCINKMKQYKTIMIQIMINANKKATKSKPAIFKWSKKLRDNGKQMRYWNERKRSSENGDPDGVLCKIPKGFKPAAATTHDEVMNEYYNMQADWIKTKDTSAILHHQFMIDLIEHIGEKRSCSKETAQKLLYHQEASRAGHEKQGKYLKNHKRGLLTELLIPIPHTKDNTAHMRITDEKSIEEILLRRNKTKLSEAVISPFCKGPLADIINENGRCETSSRIIDGRFDVRAIDNMNLSHKKELKMLMHELVRKKDDEGKRVPDVDTTISMRDYQNMFNKKNELTSCGPRGIIMPHWKMIAEDDQLSTIQAWLMEAPFKHGFTYVEWEISVHCMIMKDELPFYHRLRIIQLFEGDMNGALQLLFGRRQMQYMEKYKLNSDATYGGRKGKGCYQALNSIQYTTLYSRTMRQPMGLVDVDATGCFDRMVGRLLSLINQCNGMTQQAASCQAEVLHNMKHFVKTTRGISEKYIQRDKQTLLEGNGQGNAASVPGWHGHNEIMCKVYKKMVQGSRITSPDRSVDFEQWLSSFIDDNKMLLSFDNEDTHEHIIKECQRSLQSWEVLLNLTGGAVELKKCFITVLRYGENYKWYSNRPGVPQLERNRDKSTQCIITREGEKGTMIRQQDTKVGVRLLGIMAAANGTYEQEFQVRLEKSRDIAGKLQAAPLNIALSWQVYYCRWKPAITYCLPITTFNAKECKRIQSPFYNALLPKLGINRNMPRALLHGSSQVAGLGLVDLEAEQLAMHVTGLISQLRKYDRVGQTIHASIDALQLYLGTKEQFFKLQAHNYEHRPERRQSQLVYIWEELNLLGCKLISTKFWTPKLNGINDVAVIDAIMETKTMRQGTSNHLPRTSIWYANACRLYLNITMLSEITTPCGKFIYNWAMDGSQINNNNVLVYPNQRKPPLHVWKVWRECLLATFLKKSSIWRPTLNQPIQWQVEVQENEWRNKIRHGMTMEDAINELPDYVKEAIGTLVYPDDNGYKISQDLTKSLTKSWTDGTVKDKIGAHAYTIRPADDSESNSIRGAGGTPGDSSTMTSLRAEHFGVLVVIILLDVVAIIHGNRTKGNHQHYTDSKTVITRVENEEYMTDKKYDCTDYDVWKETVNAVSKAKLIGLELLHVKGHQREYMHEVLKEQGPLTREATYNDWCDKAAEVEREDQHLPVQLCFIKAAIVYLQTKETLVTASSYSVIYTMKTKPNAEEYVRQKLGLTIMDQQRINWEAMSSYVKTLAISQRVKVMKYIYDWQNVGTQKKLHQWADTDEYLCPFACGEIEGSMHYLVCKKACDKMSRMCMEAINRWMIVARTNNKVRVQIMELLYEKLPIKRNIIKVQYNTTSALFEQALEEQECLGWKLTMKGLLSKKWGELQEEEYTKIRKREKLEVWYTGTWWTKHLIKHIIFWALNEWQKRNEQLHNEIENRIVKSKRKQCNDDIMNIYQQQEERPAAHLKRYFRTPLIDKLQQNTIRQQQWIDTIRALRDKAAIQKSKNNV